MFGYISANSNVSTDYFLYECTATENDALVSQINNKTKISWEQSRMVASSMGSSGIEFPWDEEKNDESDEQKVETTQQDLKESYQRYLDHINAIK